MKLNAIKPKTSTGEELQPISIDYYGEVIAGTPYFPSQYSTDIDHWGYYNGAGNEENLIPIGTTVEVYNLPNNSPSSFQLTYGEANREPSVTATLTGAIKKITYPLGGTMEYEYELNEVEKTLSTQEIFNLTVCEITNECCNDTDAAAANAIYISSDIKSSGWIELNLDYHQFTCGPEASLILEIRDPISNTVLQELSVNS